MKFVTKINAICKTDGKGLWSNSIRSLNHKKLEINISDWSIEYFLESKKYKDLHGELRVFFNKKDWNIDKFGLVYTDPLWIKDFRKYLIYLGYSKQASKNVDYSEQGMQGNNYISLDFGEKFIKYFLKIKNINL